MTIYKAYFFALRATVTLTYIPVMTTGLYDTFPGSPGTFSGHIRWFPGPFFSENIDIFAKIDSQIYRVSEVLLCVKSTFLDPQTDCLDLQYLLDLPLDTFPG